MRTVSGVGYFEQQLMMFLIDSTQGVQWKRILISRVP